MADYVQVSTATETREQATTLAREAVNSKLAAGVQVSGPVVSVFWHLGELGQSEEWRVLFRTSADRYSDLEKYVIENHPWQNPEVVAVPIVAGSESYLRWIQESTEVAGADER